MVGHEQYIKYINPRTGLVRNIYEFNDNSYRVGAMIVSKDGSIYVVMNMKTGKSSIWRIESVWSEIRLLFIGRMKEGIYCYLSWLPWDIVNLVIGYLCS